MWRRGTQALGDTELLALILGTGVRGQPVIEHAAALVRAVGGLPALSRASPRELAQLRGIGVAQAARVVAAFELGRRAVELIQHRDWVGHPDDIFRCVAPRLSGLVQEVFLVVGVDIRNGLLDIVEVGRGTVSSVDIHPREVFRPLLRMAAAGGVLVHNHPSGDPTPSAMDVKLTRRLRKIGAQIGVPIVDHVVIGHRCYRSVVDVIDAMDARPPQRAPARPAGSQPRARPGQGRRPAPAAPVELRAVAA